MRTLLHRAMLFGSLVVLTEAYAYSISCNSSGTTCTVTCDNREVAGTMYWNGTRWSDGIRSSTDRDDLARQIVAAQGTACR